MIVLLQCFVYNYITIKPGKYLNIIFNLYKENRLGNCLGSLVVLSATATDLGFNFQVEQKVLLGFSMKFSVAARS